jgi:ribosome-binding protein aMBF1 (putative translation factor)
MTMSAQVIPTADELAPAATGEEYPPRTSPIDRWIGSRLRIKRTSRGMSRQELSKLLGVDRNDLARFEEGTERVNANLLFRISKSLNVSPDYFFRGYIEEKAKTS